MLHRCKNIVRMELGARIKDRRIQLGLSQKECGALVHMDASVISHIESGHRKLTTDQLKSFATALRTSESWLLHGTGPVDVDDTSEKQQDEHLHLREQNAALKGQLEESRSTVIMLKDMLRDMFNGLRGGG